MVSETLVRFYTETCWVHCNTKILTYQDRSRRFVPADLAGPVIFHAKFHIYTSALLNEIINNLAYLITRPYKLLLLHCSG